MLIKRGAEVEQSLNKSSQKVDFKNAFIRLKDGESVRVRILAYGDFVEYPTHGSFVKGIYTQACKGDDTCPLCIAYKNGGEEWADLKPVNRYMFAFADIDAGEIRFFDASKSQAKKLIEQIKEYQDVLDEYAFIFKRTGKGKDTSYTLNLIPKMKNIDKEKFAKFDGESISDELFEAVCSPRPLKVVVKTLKDAGFNVEKYWDKSIYESEYDDVEPINDEIVDF